MRRKDDNLKIICRSMPDTVYNLYNRNSLFRAAVRKYSIESSNYQECLEVAVIILACDSDNTRRIHNEIMARMPSQRIITGDTND